MTISRRRRIAPARFAAFAALLLSASTACAPHGTRSGQTPTPARSTDSLSSEIRRRHDDLIGAFRRGDTALFRGHLTPNAILITPKGDTIRGVPAIGAAANAFRRSMEIETIRATAAGRVVRCLDGILERDGEWTLTIVQPDSTRKFDRGPLDIRWITSGDSLRANIVSFLPSGITEQETDCTSLDDVRKEGRRIEIGGGFSPYELTSFYTSSKGAFEDAGYNPHTNTGDNRYWPTGAPPNAAQMLTISGRLTDKFWLTFTMPRHEDKTQVGRCNTTTYHYVRVHRSRGIWGAMVDYKLPRGFAVGVGPSVARERTLWYEGNFRPVPFDPNNPRYSSLTCGTSLNRADSVIIKRGSTGIAANITKSLTMGPNASIITRLQFFRYPNEQLPQLGNAPAFSIRDLQTMWIVGMVLGW